MDQKVTNYYLEQARELFELFDWWYPQRLVEETGIKADRIKYLSRLRKEFNGSAGPDPTQLTKKQIDILNNFTQGLNFPESKALEDLLPSELDGDQFKFVDLFAGIGGIRYPFSSIGGQCVLTCEWDEYAQKTYKANWKSCEDHRFVSDIKSLTQPKDKNSRAKSGKTQVNHIEREMPDHDVLLAGFPCQPFSIAGVSKKNHLKRAHGFECEDQGQLFFDICRILTVKQPPIAVLENVKNLKSHNKGTTFEVIREMLSNLPDHQETLFPGAPERLAIDDSGLTPCLHMWHNLIGEKFAIGVSEHALFFGEFSLQHGAPPGAINSAATSMVRGRQANNDLPRQIN